MTAGKGALDPAPDPFAAWRFWDYDLDDLAMVGVRPDPAQIATLTDDSTFVMVAWAVPDPYYDTGERPRWVIPRMQVADSAGNERRTVVIPVLGSIDRSAEAYDDLKLFYGDDALRFPSLPVRISVPNGWEEFEGHVRPVRVWDLWPVSAARAFDVQTAAEGVYEHGWLADARHFCAEHYGRLGENGECHLVRDEVPLEKHNHGVDPEDRSVMRCWTGQEWKQRKMRELFHRDQIGAWKPHTLMFYFQDPVQASTWCRLGEISWACTHNAATIAPLTERDELIRREEGQTPWVLS